MEKNELFEFQLVFLSLRNSLTAIIRPIYHTFLASSTSEMLFNFTIISNDKNILIDAAKHAITLMFS